jgi:hypothetical protein
VLSGAGELVVVNTRLKGHSEPSSLLWNLLGIPNFYS